MKGKSSGAGGRSGERDIQEKSGSVSEVVSVAPSGVSVTPIVILAFVLFGSG